MSIGDEDLAAVFLHGGAQTFVPADVDLGDAATVGEVVPVDVGDDEEAGQWQPGT